MSEFEQIMAKLNDLESLIAKSNMGNSKPATDLVSAKTLSQMWEVEERTIMGWVTLARTKPTAEPIPFVRLPGSRLIRFPLKEAREWYSRGQSHD